MTTIQSAVSDCCNSETNGINGVAGDSTGKEYWVHPWYRFGWTHVFRHPNALVKKYIIQNAIAAALNNNIGYSQNTNQTFWHELQKVNYDASKITTPCNSDCSASTSAVCMAAGYLANDVSLQNLGPQTTRTMVSSYPRAGFQMITDRGYLESADLLQPGDVLLRENKHTCIYVGEVTYDETTQVFTAENATSGTMLPMSSMNNGGSMYSMFSSQFEQGDAVVREFCYLDKNMKRSHTPSSIRLSAINYAPLVEDIAEASGIYLTTNAALMGNANVNTEQLSGNCKILVDFLISKGLNGAAAVGVAANVEAESSFNPACVGDHGTSFGICQWHNDRGTRMKNWVGPNWATNLSGQMEYLWKDLNDSYRNTLNFLQSAPNTVEGAQDCAEYFVRDFERPSDIVGAVRRRRAKAVEYWNQLIITTTESYGSVAEQPPVGDEFFINSAIIGNSLVEGLKGYSSLKTLTYFYKRGTTITEVLKSKDLITLCSKHRDRIYIELGTNEMYLSTDRLISQYTTLLTYIKTARPESKIYVVSVLPVTKQVSNEGTFTMTKVNDYNIALEKLASQKGCSYLDVCSKMVGVDGYLPYELSSDGRVHLKAEGYKIWENYMRTHY